MADVQAEQERLTAELEGAYASLTQSGEQARKLRARADAAYRALSVTVAALAECAKADLPPDLDARVLNALVEGYVQEHAGMSRDYVPEESNDG
jgi:multidrug resistance efflux pump